MASDVRTRRSTWLTAITSVSVVAVVVASLAIILDDPEIPVEPRVVEGVTSSETVETPSTATISQSVAGLERLEGVLRPSGEADEWSLGGLEIDVGPVPWMRSTIAEADIDKNGEVTSIYEELRGVSGERVEIWVRFDNTRDDAELFAIEQTFLRDPNTPQPPWADGGFDE